MKKNKLYFIILMIIVIVSLVITVKKIYNFKIDIQEENDKVWDVYDSSLNTIKINMDSITEPNESFFWWTLKDFTIDDEEYEKVLNTLVAKVRMCYLGYTDDGTLYTNSNPIIKYKNKNIITKKELEKLNFDMLNEQSCINSFDYNNLLISKNEELRNSFLNRINKINEIKETKLFTNDKAEYSELLLRKTIEIHLIEDISYFLVEEYNRLK